MKKYEFKEIVLDVRMPILRVELSSRPQPLYGHLIFPITNDLNNVSAYFDSWTESDYKIISNPNLLHTKIRSESIQRCEGFEVKHYEIISYEIVGYNYPNKKSKKKLNKLEKNWLELAH